jgi:hypothetical protein
MAYAVIHKFPGGTKEQYEKALATVHPGSGLPEGQVLHIAGSTDDGWVIFAVHTSKADWEKFRDGTLLPALSKGIPGAFTAPPEETGFEVQNEVHA